MRCRASRKKGNRILVGFAAETRTRGNARAKLKRKHLD